VVSNADRLDGLAVDEPFPHTQAEELGSLAMTAQDNAMDLESARQRVME
jgi:hypothetical protein